MRLHEESEVAGGRQAEIPSGGELAPRRGIDPTAGTLGSGLGASARRARPGGESNRRIMRRAGPGRGPLPARGTVVSPERGAAACRLRSNARERACEPLR